MNSDSFRFSANFRLKILDENAVKRTILFQETLKLMDSIYGIRLRGNYDAIVRDLDAQKYWNVLFQERVFDFDDMDEVKAEKTRKKQAELLLAKVQRSGPRSIEVFVNALNTSQPHLFELFQREVPEERIQRHVQAGG